MAMTLASGERRAWTAQHGAASDRIITAIDQRGRAKATVTIINEGGVAVIEAEISGVVPGVEERKVLGQMLSEGDPTNGLTTAGTPEEPQGRRPNRS